MANNNPDFNRDIAEETDAVKRGDNAAMSVHSFYGLAYVMNVSMTSYWEGQESSTIISTAAAAEYLHLPPKTAEPLKPGMTLDVRLAAPINVVLLYTSDIMAPPTPPPTSPTPPTTTTTTMPTALPPRSPAVAGTLINLTYLLRQ